MQHPAPRRRLAPLVAGAVAAMAACADTTGHDGLPSASLALRPVFPASLASGVFDLAVDRVRVRLMRPPAEAVLDTLVFFPAGESQLAVRLKVPLAARREQLVAALELRSKEILLFAGTATIDVVEGSSTAPPVPLLFVGPGTEMTDVRIAPRDTALKPGDRFTFIVAATAAGVPLEQFYVGWTTSDLELAPVDAVGTLTAPAQRGQVMLHVISPTGIKDSTRISFSPPTQSLVLVSGDRQTGVAGQALPQVLTVRALAADQLGVPGVRIRFNALSNGQVRDTLVITDAEGFASTVGVLGPAPGPQAFEALATGFPAVTFLATAQIGPAARIEALAGDAQVDTVGQTLRTPLIARVVDQVGNPVAGVSVTWAVISGGGTLGQTTGVTNLSGIAFADYALGPFPGTNVVRASMATPPGSVDFTATAIADAPSSITIHSGDLQVDTAAATLAPFVVTVTDRFGNLLRGILVRWSEVQGGGVLNPAVSGTSSAGRAQTTYRLPTAVGTVNVVAEVVGLPLSTVFQATVLPATAFALTAVSGDGQTAPIGGVLTPFAVRVTDRFGNPVPGVTVTWEIVAGGGILSAPTSTADPNGIAVVTYTLGLLPGLNTVRAILPSGATVTFTATGT